MSPPVPTPSIVFSLVFATINSGVDAGVKVDAGTSTALFGYLLGGAVGFIGDQIIGTDQGHRIYKNKHKKNNEYFF